MNTFVVCREETEELVAQQGECTCRPKSEYRKNAIANFSSKYGKYTTFPNHSINLDSCDFRYLNIIASHTYE